MSGARAAGRRIAHVELLSVQLELGAEGSSAERPSAEHRSVGVLAWKRDSRVAYFEYDRDFLAAPLPLSPFRLATRPGAIAAPHSPFGGLHGLFNDSLPDGWGRRLLDRRLAREGFDARGLTPVDRLAYVGTGGMGALRFVPEQRFANASAGEIDLDWLAGQAAQVEGEAEALELDLLQAAQGGSGGVRPKLMVGFDAGGRIIADTGHGLAAGFEPWIVKFRALGDPPEIGAEEYAYSLMAKAAGIDMPETRLIETAGGRYFAVKRFDRSNSGPLHVHTASGLLDADHRTPSIDYEDLLKLARALTRDARHVRQIFRRMIFNLLAHNRDDHAKNHAFMMDAGGSWRPTPAYDLTFSDGPGGEHNLAIAGEGRDPEFSHVLKVAADAAIPRGEAGAMFDQARDSVRNWPEFAEAAGLGRARMAEIAGRLSGLGGGA